MRKRMKIALLSLSVSLLLACDVASQLQRDIIIKEEVAEVQLSSNGYVVDNVFEFFEIQQSTRVRSPNAQTQRVSEAHAIRNVVRSYTATASWYRHGKVTANGERFNPHGLTVAHKRLPFDTMVRFTNMETGVSIIARVNDRGPYIRGREFDLSLGCAIQLGIVERGATRLKVEILERRT